MTRDSIYKPSLNRREKRFNRKFNYKDVIIKRSISSKLFGSNDTLDTFLKYINDIIYNSIESVKIIKNWANFAVDKYENKLE